MSYEQPVKKGEEYWGRRQAGVEYLCARCAKPIKGNQPLVIWDSIRISENEFEAQLTPIAVLAAQTNPTEHKQRVPYYTIDLVLHTHCAVYLGGHLVKDGLNDNEVSTTLRKAIKD